MGLLEIIVVVLLVTIVGLAFFYSRKAEAITQAKANQKRLQDEQNKGKGRK